MENTSNLQKWFNLLEITLFAIKGKKICCQTIYVIFYREGKDGPSTI